MLLGDQRAVHCQDGNQSHPKLGGAAEVSKNFLSS